MLDLGTEVEKALSCIDDPAARKQLRQYIEKLRAKEILYDNKDAAIDKRGAEIERLENVLCNIRLQVDMFYETVKGILAEGTRK